MGCDWCCCPSDRPAELRRMHSSELLSAVLSSRTSPCSTEFKEILNELLGNERNGSIDELVHIVLKHQRFGMGHFKQLMDHRELLQFDQMDEGDMTPLMVAASYRRDPHFTEMLIDTAQCLPHHRIRCQSTSNLPGHVLECAAYFENVEVFQLLMDRDRENSIEWTDDELVACLRFMVYHNIAKHQYYTEILDRCRDIDTLCNHTLYGGQHGKRPLLHCVYSMGNGPLLLKLLKYKVFRLNIRDSTDHGEYVLLHRAAIDGNYKLLDVLLRSGATPTVLDREHNTALHLVCTHASKEGIEYILSKKALLKMIHTYLKREIRRKNKEKLDCIGLLQVQRNMLPATQWGPHEAFIDFLHRE